MSQKFIFHAGESDIVRRNCNAFLAALPNDKNWQVEVKQYRRTRSNAQNNALWGCAYPVICDETGYDPDDLHDALCRKHFGEVDHAIAGVRVTRPYRTTTRGPDGKRSVLDSREFSDFYEFVQRIGAECGVFVPDPEPKIPEHARAAVE